MCSCSLPSVIVTIIVAIFFIQFYNQTLGTSRAREFHNHVVMSRKQREKEMKHIRGEEYIISTKREKSQRLYFFLGTQRAHARSSIGIGTQRFPWVPNTIIQRVVVVV
jgi:hypothetical protein